MQTIGERLEEARKKKGISIREAAEATKIRGDYLQKFESNQFDIGLTEIYTRGFLRTYSNFLKLPADRLLNDYSALGRGDIKPRQPNREIYGRMDISVAHAESGESGTPAPETVPPPERSHANRGPARPRTGSSLPTGPDPAVVFKYVKWGAIGLGALILLFIVISFWPSKRGSPAGGNGVTSVPRGLSFGIIATKPVKVTIRKKNPDGSDGEFVFSSMLTAGEQKTIPWTATFYLEATPAENLEVEINRMRQNWGTAVGAQGRGELDPSKAK
jgi:cytoskeleton protein RodZ